MKRFLLLVLMSVWLYAADVSWYTSYVKAAEAAKSEGKPMLVFMNKPGCGSCEYMKENVFTDAAVVDFLQKNYIAVSLDIHGNDAPAELQMNVTPVFHFLQSDGNKAQETLVGGKTAPFFLKLLKKASTTAH